MVPRYCATTNPKKKMCIAGRPMCAALTPTLPGPNPLFFFSLHRHILASGSADKTVKIWDVATGACVTTLKHHTDKVQAVQWHPAEPTVIVTGAYDRVVSVQDVRQPNSRTTFATSVMSSALSGIRTTWRRLPSPRKMET